MTQPTLETFFAPKIVGQRVAHDRLARTCFIDYDREMALVAERSNAEIIGVGRLTKLHVGSEAEFTVIVSD